MVGTRVEATSRDRRRWWHALEGGGQIEAQHDELPNSGPRHGLAVFTLAGQAEKSPAEMCGGGKAGGSIAALSGWHSARCQGYMAPRASDAAFTAVCVPMI